MKGPSVLVQQTAVRLYKGYDVLPLWELFYAWFRYCQGGPEPPPDPPADDAAFWGYGDKRADYFRRQLKIQKGEAIAKGRMPSWMGGRDARGA